jgi:hypothetical protein
MDTMSKYMILIRHFMVRLANNELVSFQDERQDMQAAGFAMLTIGGGLLAHMVFGKFLLVHSSIKITSTWTEHTYFFGFLMAVTGLVSLTVWDHFFLDRFDFQNLAALPLKSRTLFIARFLSTLLFVMVIGIALNLFSSFVVYMYLAENLLIHPLRFMAAHVVSSFLAVLFVVFAVAAIQGIAMRLFKPQLYRRVKFWMQVLFLMVFVSVFVWTPGFYPLLRELKATDSFLFYLYPPSWFGSLHEWIAGALDPFHSRLGAQTLVLVICCLALYMSTIPRSMKLHLQMSEEQKNMGRPSLKRRGLWPRVTGLVFKDSIQLGIFEFIVHTLRRSRRHQFYLVLVLSASIGFALTQLVFMFVKRGAGYINSIQIPLLSLPFILGFCVLTGIRILVELPISPSANWVFKMTETSETSGYSAGLKKTVIILFVIPLFGLMAPLYLSIWPLATTVFFLGYCLLVILAMVELFFLDYRKIPFASVYNPASTDLKVSGMLQLGVFAIYLYLFTTIGLWLILKPVYNLVFYMGAGLFFWGLRWRERKFSRSGLVFFQESQPVMLSLNLSQ